MSVCDVVTLGGGRTVPRAAWELLLDLEARGIRLELDGDGIIARPRAKLTDDDRVQVRRWKVHIAAVLTDGDQRQTVQ